MKLIIPCLLLLPALCSGSSLLTQTARDVLAQSHDRAKAEVFLQQAILENAQDPEPLTLLAVLKSFDFRDNPEELIAQVAPLLTQLVALREQNSKTKPADLALALEMNSRFLEQVGRGPEAKYFQARSLLIRRQLVQELNVEKKVFPDQAEIFRVSRDMSHPSVLTKEDPEYSNDARISKISGTVLIETVVDREGYPTRISLVRSLGFGLDEKAAQAVAAWRFKPGSIDGQPVPVKATIEVNFRLL